MVALVQRHLPARAAWIPAGLLACAIALWMFLAAGPVSGVNGPAQLGVVGVGASAHAVTPAEFAALGDGATRAQVAARIGAPGGATEDPTGSGLRDCDAYAAATGGHYVLCFSGGRLALKQLV